MCSLGDVLGLSAGAGVGALLSLVVRIDGQNTSVVLNSLLGSTHDLLLCTFCFLNLGSLISDLTITGH